MALTAVKAAAGLSAFRRRYDHRSRETDGIVAEGFANTEQDLAPDDDFSREVYCVLGMPIDAVDMRGALDAIEGAATCARTLLVSTLNLNFLAQSREDTDFRQSLLTSDLCVADGVPIVWLSRLLGIPLKERVAGSDIFEILTVTRRSRGPLKVFLFGAAEGIAAAAGRALNDCGGGLMCVGSLFPGFGTIEEMSCNAIIDQINASGADFLVASLSAKKGQSWLMRNHRQLRIPIRAHLGAVVNFRAGNVKRAPPLFRKLGVEWLWRIKEEPYLWTRYWRDGLMLLRLLFRHVIPLVAERWRGLRAGDVDFEIRPRPDQRCFALSLSGVASKTHASRAVPILRNAVRSRKRVSIDLSAVRFIDARFFGLFLVLRKQLHEAGAALEFTGVSQRLERLFCLNEVGFLLSQRT